ncbi:MAG: hypothetical protein NTW86_12680, partial [Candidatus Sumerlaeota bacterium]|nr:hypothetical protein [Candidatus Sumerlaeota bacterium]
MAHAEMVVVPGATRLFDAPAALRVLSERSVDWFQKTLVGAGEPETIVRERLSRESKRRLAAVASLFLMGGWALAPKSYAVVTAFFDASGASSSIAGHLGIQIGATTDNAITVGTDGSGNVVINGGAVVIDDNTAPGTTGNVLTPSASSVRRIVVNTTGQIGGAVTNGARTIDCQAVTAASFTGLAAQAAPNAANGTATNYFVLIGDGSGASRIYGSAFCDSISGGTGNDYIVGGDGPDHIVGGGNQDTVEAGSGNDWINMGNNGAANTPVVSCGPGNDTIDVGGYYSAQYDGGDGVDMFMTQGFIASEGNNLALTSGSVEGSGSVVKTNRVSTPVTTYTCNFTNMEIPILAGRGSTGNYNASDSLDASGWTGTLGVGFHDGGNSSNGGGDGSNGGGDDTIIGTNGPDSATLNIGNDFVSLGGGTNVVVVNSGPLGTTYTSSIYPTMNGTDSDRITFNAYLGATGSPTVYLDTILAGTQVLAISGTGMVSLGDGTAVGDTLDVSGVTLASVVSVSGNDGSDLIIGSANADALNGGNQNDTILGGDGGDTIAGNADDDSLLGEAGDDNMTGAAGNDTISGGAGNDTLDQGFDTNVADGGADTDVMNRSFGSTINGSSAVLTDSTLTITQGTTLVESDALSSIEQANLTGGGQYFTNTTPINDSIDANAFTGRVSLSGGSGDDTIAINFGADSLVGGGGTDLLSWNINIDSSAVAGTRSTVPADVRVTLAGGAGDSMQFLFGTDTMSYGLDGFENVQLVGSSGNDILDIGNVTDTLATPIVTGNGGADSIVGSPLADQLNGNGQNDTIEGNGGADTLTGGTQNDNLAGGAGDDQYVGLSGTDVISDAGGVDTV